MQDHGTTVADAVKAVVRRDEWVPSRPWFADLHFPDGHVWKGWQQFFRTKKSLMAAIHAAAPEAQIEAA